MKCPTTTLGVVLSTLLISSSDALSVPSSSRVASGKNVLPTITRAAATKSLLFNSGPLSKTPSSSSFRSLQKVKLAQALFATAAAADENNSGSSNNKSSIRSEGGRFSFNTKYGALNPFGIYYALVSIMLGLIWFAELSTCQLIYFLTRGKVDKKRRLPVTFSHIWGVMLMFFTRGFPTVENREVLKELENSKRPAMFVANHNSWMDIPYLGYTIGWKNYKMVAKKELEKVPVLGKAIKVGGNVMVDRKDRRSQLMTLKAGMNWLKDGVNLCTFPEGTRSRSGRLMPFKKGAFKMAHKMGAPIVPLSIVGSAKVMPSHWMFPFRPSTGVAHVVVHEPIESKDKTEDELADAVREAVISGLPEDQRPR